MVVAETLVVQLGMINILLKQIAPLIPVHCLLCGGGLDPKPMLSLAEPVQQVYRSYGRGEHNHNPSSRPALLHIPIPEWPGNEDRVVSLRPL